MHGVIADELQLFLHNNKSILFCHEQWPHWGALATPVADQWGHKCD
jgi:hypothetical protein